MGYIGLRVAVDLNPIPYFPIRTRLTRGYVESIRREKDEQERDAFRDIGDYRGHRTIIYSCNRHAMILLTSDPAR